MTRETAAQQQIRELAQTATALASHVSDCSRRYGDTQRAFEKLERSIEKSSDNATAASEKLEIKFDKKHSENKKYFIVLVAAAVPILLDRIISWAISVSHVVVH